MLQLCRNAQCCSMGRTSALSPCTLELEGTCKMQSQTYEYIHICVYTSIEFYRYRYTQTCIYADVDGIDVDVDDAVDRIHIIVKKILLALLTFVGFPAIPSGSFLGSFSYMLQVPKSGGTKI